MLLYRNSNYLQKSDHQAFGAIHESDQDANRASRLGRGILLQIDIGHGRDDIHHRSARSDSNLSPSAGQFLPDHNPIGRQPRCGRKSSSRPIKNQIALVSIDLILRSRIGVSWRE